MATFTMPDNDVQVVTKYFKVTVTNETAATTSYASGYKVGADKATVTSGEAAHRLQNTSWC